MLPKNMFQAKVGRAGLTDYGRPLNRLPSGEDAGVLSSIIELPMLKISLC